MQQSFRRNQRAARQTIIREQVVAQPGYVSNRRNNQNRQRMLQSAMDQARNAQIAQQMTPVSNQPRRNRRNRNTQAPSSNRVTNLGQIFRTGGAIVGGLVGQPKMGAALGAGISRIFGQGDYQVQSNSLTQGGPPAFAGLDSGIRMAHREFVTDVLSSTAFQNTTYQITPTNSTLFPWLSKIAVNFEEYAIRGMVFYYNTTSGNAVSSTNNALGVVGMTTVYDPTDPDLASKREAEDYGGCVAGVPSNSLLHPVECKPRSDVLDRLYVQISPIANAEDLKFYSKGKLNLFTQGMQQAGVTIGELWVSYDIEFYKPKILPIGSVGAAGSKLTVLNSACNSVQLFGFNNLSQVAGNLGVTYTITGGVGNLNIPSGTAAGYYLVSWSGTSNVAIAANFTITATSSNLQLVNAFQGNSVPTTSQPNASQAVPFKGQDAMVYKTDAGAASFRLYANTGDTSVATISADIFVVKVPASLGGGMDTGLQLKQTDLSLFDQQQTDFMNKMKESILRGEMKGLIKKMLREDSSMISSEEEEEIPELVPVIKLKEKKEPSHDSIE